MKGEELIYLVVLVVPYAQISVQIPCYLPINREKLKKYTKNSRIDEARVRAFLPFSRRTNELKLRKNREMEGFGSSVHALQSRKRTDEIVSRHRRSSRFQACLRTS